MSVVAEAVTAEGLVGPIYEAVSIRSLRGREAEVAALKASLVLFAGLATTSKGDRMSVTENEDEAAEVALGLQFTGLGLCEASGANSCLGGIGSKYPERYATSMLALLRHVANILTVPIAY